MEAFSYQQKIAIMRILLDIVHADGFIDERELFYFNQLKEYFELTDEDHEIVNHKNSLLALSQIRKFDEEQKSFFSKLMSKMIVIDEDINANEVAIYSVVQDFCMINQQFADNLTSEEITNCSTSK